MRPLTNVPLLGAKMQSFVLTQEHHANCGTRVLMYGSSEKHSMSSIQSPCEKSASRVTETAIYAIAVPQCMLPAEGVPVVGSQESPFVPIEVVGTIREDGLGLVSWW